ncbi:MAG: porin [Yoonia sp.]|uniref:hypothetical protein n=1 Tax=Yoonia sp. TaxID=2212373 RepID=UPI00273DD8C6|nr:hypothetical protein [Yoonia sp.]MDP5086202.1 porin [Yoonia sp.]
MLNKILMTTACVFASSTAVFAQGFSGAELSIEYSDVTDVEDLGSIIYSGSAEVELLYGVSAAGDFTIYNFEVDRGNLSNLTGHLSYSINSVTTLGIFFGRDNTDGEDSGMFGGEIAYDFGVGEAQAYFGSADDPLAREVTLYGAAVDYDFGSGFGFEANYDGFTGDDFSASAFEVGGYYELQQGLRLGATIGTLTQEDVAETSETFFALKASIAVGQNGGTTFGPRGVYEVFKANIDAVAVP